MSTIDPETMPRCARTHGTPQLEALDSWATLLLAVARRQHDQRSHLSSQLEGPPRPEPRRPEASAA